MPTELSIGRLTDKEKGERQATAARYQHVQMGMNATINSLLQAAYQHGVADGKLYYRIEKAHGWDHDAAYRYAPDGEVFRIIPDPPPIAEKDKGVN